MLFCFLAGQTTICTQSTHACLQGWRADVGISIVFYWHQYYFLLASLYLVAIAHACLLSGREQPRKLPQTARTAPQTTSNCFLDTNSPANYHKTLACSQQQFAHVLTSTRTQMQTITPTLTRRVGGHQAAVCVGHKPHVKLHFLLHACLLAYLQGRRASSSCLHGAHIADSATALWQPLASSTSSALPSSQVSSCKCVLLLVCAATSLWPALASSTSSALPSSQVSPCVHAQVCAVCCC